LPDSGLDPEVGLRELGKEAVCATALRQNFQIFDKHLTDQYFIHK